MRNYWLDRKKQREIVWDFESTMNEVINGIMTRIESMYVGIIDEKQTDQDCINRLLELIKEKDA